MIFFYKYKVLLYQLLYFLCFSFLAYMMYSTDNTVEISDAGPVIINVNA